MSWLGGLSVNVKVGGDRLVYMALSDDSVIPNASYFYGKGAGVTPETGFVATPVSKEGSDSSLAKQLWDKSYELVQPWMD
jgi:hypothetical protein